MEWKDIITAPKDRPIRIYNPIEPWTAITIMPAMWTGYYWRKMHRNGFVNMIAYPTHWMLLPGPVSLYKRS